MIQVNSCTYVNSSQLVKGLDKANNAWAECADNVSYGDNDRTLISLDRYAAILNEAKDEAIGDDDADTLGEIETLFQRFNTIRDCMYIDLEN